MKKNYFMLAAATMMLAACAETDLVNEVNTVAEPQAIGFETFTNKATRATENNQGDYSWKLQDHHTTFKVWGGKNADGSLQSVYAKDAPGVVTYGTAWVADPLKYWDKTAEKYDFMAAAPAVPAAGVNWVATTTTDHDFSTATLALNNFVLKGTNLSVKESTNDYEYNWKGDQDVDLLISENTEVLRGAYNKATPDDVNLDFIHILSRLNIIVKKGAGITATVNVTGLKVYNLMNKGSFNEATAAVNTTPGTATRWSGQTVEGTYILEGKPTDAIVADDARYIIQSLVIPQTINTEEIDVDGTDTEKEAYFEIQYTIDGEAYHGFYNLAKAMGDATYTFGEGWQNNLTITINPAGITFSGDVSTWAVVKDGGSID